MSPEPNSPNTWFNQVQLGFQLLRQIQFPTLAVLTSPTTVRQCQLKDIENPSHTRGLGEFNSNFNGLRKERYGTEASQSVQSVESTLLPSHVNPVCLGLKFAVADPIVATKGAS